MTKEMFEKGTQYMGCFINFSNHPSKLWLDQQREAAQSYGEIIDLSFPAIQADASEEEVLMLAGSYCDKILSMDPAAVMCQGEFTLSYAVIQQLLKKGVCCVAACSDRVTTEKQEDGKTVKQAAFVFVRFREYRGLKE